MSILSKAKRAFELLDIGIDALQTIGQIAKLAVSDTSDKKVDNALRTLGVIAAIAESVKEGLGEEFHPDDIRKRIEELRKSLLSNDAKADSDLDAKFKNG